MFEMTTSVKAFHVSSTAIVAILVINFVRVLTKYFLGKKLSLFDIFSAAMLCPPAYAILWAMSLKRSIESEGKHHG